MLRPSQFPHSVFCVAHRQFAPVDCQVGDLHLRQAFGQRSFRLFLVGRLEGPLVGWAIENEAVQEV